RFFQIQSALLARPGSTVAPIFQDSVYPPRLLSTGWGPKLYGGCRTVSPKSSSSGYLSSEGSLPRFVVSCPAAVHRDVLPANCNLVYRQGCTCRVKGKVRFFS